MIKDELHVITSLDSEKAFEKIQQTFIIKVLKSIGVHGSYLKIIKPVYHKPIANINLQERNSSYFHYNLEQDKLSYLSYLLNIVI